MSQPDCDLGLCGQDVEKRFIEVMKTTNSVAGGRRRFVGFVSAVALGTMSLAGLAIAMSAQPASASAHVPAASAASPANTSGLPLPLRSPIHQTSRDNDESYTVAADGDIYHNYVVNGQWVGWSSLGQPATGVFGDVAWGTNYLNNQELYVKSNDGQVYHMFATPGHGSGWSGWDPMGTPPTGIRGDVREGTNDLGNQELYVIGSDARVWHVYSTPGQGSGWSAWGSLGGPDAISGDMTVTSGVGVKQTVTVLAAGRTYSIMATPGVGTGWGTWVPSPTSTPVSAVNPMVAMVNDQRAAAGIGPVAENSALDAAAVAHSDDQAAHQTMSHAGSDGSDSGQRITASGYTWWACGENVAAGQPDMASVMSAWMNSPGHRANILNANFVDIGFGQTRGANGAIYWTMDLAAPR